MSDPVRFLTAFSHALSTVGLYGDEHVRFALIENEARTRQAIRGIRDMFRKDGLL